MALESSAGRKYSVPLGRRHGHPPKAPGKEVRAMGVTPAGQAAEYVRMQSENALLKGKVKLLEDHVKERTQPLEDMRRERERADELLKERDTQLLAERTAATQAERGWRVREKKLQEDLDTARGSQCGTKHSWLSPSPVEDPGVVEDKHWLTQHAVELRTGLQQAATATALLEDSLKRADRESRPPPSTVAELDKLLRSETSSSRRGRRRPTSRTLGIPARLRHLSNRGHGEADGCMVVRDGDRMVIEG